MLKSNLLIIILILMLGACSEEQDSKILLTMYEAAVKKSKPTSRKLAGVENVKCFKDTFMVTTLKSEIEEAEKKYAPSSPVEGKWRHLDLSKLPVPQAIFLKNYGDKIGDLSGNEAIDYSPCNDLPSIFNKIYGKENDVAGYVHYLWYLKMGNMLSLDNLSPEQNSPNAGEYNEKKFELSSYLYNEDELYGFWRLTHMLKAPYTTLADLKEIQRIPRGQSFEIGGACGKAHTDGWIILNDGCLTFESRDKGYFYESVLHEMSHHIDYFEGKNLDHFYRTYLPDYRKLSRFEIAKEEVIERRDGNTIYRSYKIDWRALDDKRVTVYANTSPAEDFAETLSYFRVSGEEVLAKTPADQIAFTSQDYYHGASFTNDSLIKSWLADLNDELTKATFDIVSDCQNDTVAIQSTYFSSSDFNILISPPMLNCMGRLSEKASQNLKSSIMLSSPDACGRFNDFATKKEFEKIWPLALKKEMGSRIKKHLIELEKDQNYLAKIQATQDLLANDSMARMAVIDCYKEADEKACFEKETLIRLSEKEISQELADLYLSHNGFEKAKAKVLSSYGDFVTSQTDQIKNEAGQFWSQCSNMSPSDEAIPQGEAFTIGDGYMVSTLYNCLNLGLGDSISKIAQNITLNNQKSDHPKEQEILKEKISPLFRKSLLDEYQNRREEELKAFKVTYEKESKELTNSLLNDFSWVSDATSNQKIKDDCWQNILDKSKFSPLYHLKKDLLRENFSLCDNLDVTLEFKRWFELQAPTLSLKVVEKLDEMVSQVAQEKARLCIDKYPVDTKVNKLKFKRPREQCLLGQWEQIETESLKKMESDPLANKLKITTEEITEILSSDRRRLQIKIIKEKFN